MPINNIRVKVNKRYHKVYQELTTKNAFHGQVFETHGELFVLCTNIGFNFDDNVDTSMTNMEPLFWSHTLKNEGESCLKAIAILNENNDYNVLEDEEKIVQIAEKYADLGMQKLLDEVLKPFITSEEEDNQIAIQFTDDDYLEKEILSLIYAEIQEGPV